MAGPCARSPSTPTSPPRARRCSTSSRTWPPARPTWTTSSKDYRLARVNPVGEGAAARFRLRVPLATEYGELLVKEVDRPRRIVEELRVGRRGRNRSVAVYDFTQEAPNLTRVELTHLQRARDRVDRVREIGAAWWVRRRTKKALDRLRAIFEDPRDRAAEPGDHRGLRGRKGSPLRGAHGHGPGTRTPSGLLIDCRARWSCAAPRPPPPASSRSPRPLVLSGCPQGHRSRAWTSLPARASP